MITELGKTTRLFKVPHQEAGFKVLESPNVPSVLVELGYLSNPGDEKLMESQAWRDKAARPSSRLSTTISALGLPAGAGN